VLTSDGKLKACSFQDHGLPVASADDVHRVWRERQAELATATGRGGCARALPRPRRAPVTDGVRVWRGFSGNNSGECVLVGRFEQPEDARRYVEELLPGLVPGEAFSPAWRELLEREGIAIAQHDVAPDAMAAVGRTVLVHTHSAVDDDFPPLRTLLWKRGGRAVYSGVHEHEPVKLAAAIALPTTAALDDVEAQLAIDEVGPFQRRGPALYGFAERGHTLEERLAPLSTLAAAHGGAVAAELLPLGEDINLAHTLAIRAPGDAPEWLWATFDSAASAEAAARRIDGQVTVADRYLLVAAPVIGARLGWLLQQRGGLAELLVGPVLSLGAHFSRQKGDQPVPDQVDAELRPRLSPGDQLVTKDAAWRGVDAAVDTRVPGVALRAMVDVARDRSLDVWIHARTPDRLVHTFARLANDLRVR
jgi:hypothetical protein